MRKILSVLMVLFTAIILVGCINEDSSFNIYFVTNGGSPLETIKISEVFEASSLENYDTERSGYDFISWHTSGSLSDETIAGGSYFSDTTFYAKWQQSTEESKYYQVTFDSQGGTNIDELEVLAGGHVNAPTKPERRGYEFTGWQLDGVDYDFEQAVNSDLLLVATWKLIEGEVTTYTVTFKGEDEIVYFSDEVVAGNSVNMPSNPVMDGHKFIGWELNGNPFDFNTLITSDIVFYAVWEEIVYYRVTFNTLGGSLVDEVLVEEGLKVLKPNNPTKDNYEFVEWQLEGESFEFKTSINSDLTLDAVWTELTQNVK